MIDIHAHILPNLDDGFRTTIESLNVLHRAQAQGVTTIIATPHAMDGVYQCSPGTILQACEQLNRQIEHRQIKVRVLPGSEVRLTHETIRRFDQGNLLTLNNSGQYLLLELPPVFIIDGVAQIIQKLKDRGVTAIIAHPERNTFITKRLNILSSLLGAGARLQLTASSLLGQFGKRTQKLCDIMIKKQAVSFIASDVHQGRPYGMERARKRVQAIAGDETAHRIFCENPQNVISTVHTSMEKKELHYVR